MRKTGKISRFQEQFWLLNQLQPENPAYNIPSLVHFRGNLDSLALEKAFRMLIVKHPVLRTRLRKTENTVEQEVSPPEEVNFHPEIHHEDQDWQENVPEWMKRQIHQPFDLENEFPLRVSLAVFKENYYLLCVVVHHAFIDLQTKDILASDLSAFYNALVSGEQPEVTEKLPDYVDYAEFHGRWLASEKAEKITERWKERLSGLADLPEFPAENASNPGKRKFFILDEDLSEKVKHFARENSLSPFAVLLGAWSIFLMKVSGQQALTLGVPFSNRRIAEFKNCAGPFVNILPLKVSVSDSSDIAELLGAIRKEMLVLHRLQEIPFLTLKNISGKRSELFNTGFTFEHPFRPVFNEISCEPMIFEREGSQMDLFLTMWQEEPFFKAYLEYSSLAFTPESISRYISIFRSIVSEVTEDANQKISAIHLIEKNDLKTILEWNNTAKPYEDQVCIHDKFSDVARKRPTSTALIFGEGQHITYSRMDQLTNQLAHHLKSKGVSKGSAVAVCMPRTPQLILSLYAILKAGGAYLPLNPDFPAERQETILNDAQAGIVLCFQKDSENLPENVIRIFTDDLLAGNFPYPVTKPEVSVSPKDPAYIIYTSGSTGIPKGVVIRHHSVMNRLGWMQNEYPLDKEDTLLQKTPVTFDVSVWELFWWGFNGARLAILPEGDHKDPLAIIRAIEEFSVTHVHFVPSMFAAFMETLKSKAAFGSLKNLRRIFLSGEALPPSLVREFNRERKSYRLPELINLYGPTEATVDVSYYNCPDGEDVSKIFIGKPVDNTKLFITTPGLQVLPPGIPGELVITGVNLAAGYLNRPELNAAKFVQLELPDGQSFRAYRTGDLAKLGDNGELEYLGRIDNQLKIRGLRIEPGEIESVLLEHPLVAGALVVSRNINGQPSLVAYLVSSNQIPVEKKILQHFLGNKLPEYMIPSFFVFLDEIPLTSSGKPDRKALPSPVHASANTAKPAGNQHEKILIDLWKELLNAENIGINDNFFDVGGNSLLAVSLSNRISDRFNININAISVMEHPNIKEFSRFLFEEEGTNGSSPQERSQYAGKRRERAEAMRRKRRMN